MYPNASGAIDQYYSQIIKEKRYEDMGGFPNKIKFKVAIEEYTVKDLCSGGYIDDSGAIVFTSKAKNEEEENLPQFSEVSGDSPWPNLVDSGFSPQSTPAFADNRNNDCTVVINDTSGIRNNIYYDNIPKFCDGNRIGGSKRIIYLNTEDEMGMVTGLGLGGFSRFTGYGFDITATYAKPSYTLGNYKLDFSSIIDALRVGNEPVYDCGLLQEGGNMPLHDFDPIHFQPMVSDSSPTGDIIKDGFYGFDQSVTGGQLIHPHKIYGDHWMGLRSGCLVYVPTGLCDNVNTTYPPEPCEMDSPMGGDMAMEAYCDCLAREWLNTDGSVSDVYFSKITNEAPNYGYPDDIYNGAFLFNLSHDSIGIHFRNTPYFDGYELDGSLECEGDEGSLMDLTRGCKFVTKGHSYHITGAGISGNSKIELFKNDGSLSGLELNLAAEHVVGEGVLFELPDGMWDQSGNGNFETIIEHGARVAKGLGASQTTTTWEFDPEGTTTTQAPVTEGEFIDTSYVRVSGWKEMSLIRMKLFDFEVFDDMARYPNEDQFIFEQNGTCTMSGYLKYDRQEEASIYTEGIVLKDTSDDPMFDQIDYPHYASDVLKRPGFDLPYEETSIYQAGHNVVSAPSRMLSRWEIDFIKGVSVTGGYMVELKTKKPHNYNKFIWPTISDLFHYNGGDLSWESLPPDDGHIYPNSYLMICGENGQPIDLDENAFAVRKQYTVTQHWSLYDSMIVDPLINTKWKKALTKEDGGAIGQTVEPAGGYMVTQGTSAWEIMNNFVEDGFGGASLNKHGTEPYQAD
jgi:hypothetical protein